MTDLSDIPMDGVKPMGDAQELPIGQYFVRIEDTEKKATKDKYGDDGEKLPPNHYLQIACKVYGGPNDGQTEFVRLNLWNPNKTAYDMARSELKSIQEATGVASANSNDFHGKWMVLTVKPGIKEPTKLYRAYAPAPAEVIAHFADVPPVPAKPPAAAATPAAATVAASSPAAAPAAQPVTTAASAANALPDWAKNKA